MKLSLNIVSIFISLVAIDLDVHGDRDSGTRTGTGLIDAFTNFPARATSINTLAAKTESTEFEPHPPDIPPPSVLLACDVPRPFFADALGGEELEIDVQADDAHEELNQEPGPELDVKLEPEPDVEPVLEVELEPDQEPEVELYLEPDQGPEVELDLERALELDIENTRNVVEVLEEPIEPIISEPIISEPIISKEIQEEMAKMSKKLAENIGELLTAEVVGPLLSAKFEKGVSKDIIKGAAITGASLSFLAGQGISATGAAAAGAAYLAVTPGKGGKTVRTVGDFIWKSANTAVDLYRRFEVNRLFSSATQSLLVKAKNVIRDQQVGGGAYGEQNLQEMEKLQAEMYEVLTDVEDAVTKAEAEYDRVSRQERIDDKEDVDIRQASFGLDKMAEAKLQETESAREEEAARVAEEMRLEQDKIVEEAARLAHEALLVAEEAAKLVAEEEEAKIAEEARLAAKEETRKKEEARIAEGARLAVEEEARQTEESKIAGEAILAVEEKARQKDQARILEEARQAVEEARLAEQSRLAAADEDNTFFEEEDWEASIRLAEELDGGLPDSDLDPAGKYGWDAASRLAEELAVRDDGEDLLDLSPEELAAQAKAARDAVEIFSSREGDSLLDDDDEPSDLDLEEIDLEVDDDVSDFFENLDDVENLGKMAREAVEKLESSFDDETEEIPSPTDSIGSVSKIASSRIDWTRLTVTNLKTELKNRGLRVTGRKSDLVAALEEFDREIYSDTSMPPVPDDPTDEEMEAISKAARATADMFNSGDTYIDENSGGSGTAEASIEYQGMTVAQLKDELRSRGLKVGGRKVELIERLMSV